MKKEYQGEGCHKRKIVRDFLKTTVVNCKLTVIIKCFTKC